MLKTEGIVMVLFLLHMILMFVILWRTERSVRLLKKLLNAMVLEKEGKGYNSLSENKRCDMYQVEEVGENREVIVNTIGYEDASVDMEIQEKEKLINEVLSEIFC